MIALFFGSSASLRWKSASPANSTVRRSSSSATGWASRSIDATGIERCFDGFEHRARPGLLELLELERRRLRLVRHRPCPLQARGHSQ